MKPFSLIPKDKKLLKSGRVRKWLRATEKITKQEMEKEGIAWWPRNKSKKVKK